MESTNPSGHAGRLRMRRGSRLRLVAHATIKALMLLAVSAAAGLLVPATPQAAPAVVVVKMLDAPTEFDPPQVTISAGDSVRWQNDGNTLHDATNNPALAIDQNQVSSPAGVPAFDSGFMNPGQRFEQKFTVPGTYKYVCVPHETSGMIGTVIVK